ncbi:MAG: hypothetical protein A2Z74_02285 [Chloroflexi bacterium RBG_13_46_9]|nr:MAG: hypothetical protein A2Z74_02285 [Chloroflexi bacterium RBG_13_46_9]
MIGFNRGDVILINFVFSDESGIKLRPAIVVSSDDYHQGRNESVILAVTSRIDRLLIGDHVMADWKEAGLLYPSVATGIIRTINQDMIDRKLGTISSADMRAIDSNLHIMLNLS